MTEFLPQMRRLSHIIWAGPKCHYKDPYEREAGRDTGRRGGNGVTKETDTGVVWSQVTVCWLLPEVTEKTRDGFSPRASEGARSCLYVNFSPVITDFRLLASKLVTE